MLISLEFLTSRMLVLQAGPKLRVILEMLVSPEFCTSRREIFFLGSLLMLNSLEF